MFQRVEFKKISEFQKVPEAGPLQPRILILDDDREDAFLLSQMISHTRYHDANITVAASTKEARDLLGSRKFDVAFIDYWLGTQTCVELLREITLDFDVPAIVLSGLETDDIRKIGLRAGALDFIPKSELSRSGIENCIQEILRGEARKSDLMKLDGLDADLTSLAVLGPWISSMMQRTERIDRLIAIRRMETLLKNLDGAGEEALLARIGSEIGFIRREFMLRLDRIGELGNAVSVNNRVFELTAILRELRDEFQFDANVRAIQIEVPASGVEVHVHADPLLVRDLFTSLFLNSLDCIGSNSQLSISIDQDDNDVYVMIMESRERTSIKEVEALLNMMQPSSTVSDMMSTPEGAQLQLATHIASSLGGTIDLDTNEADGTTFVVSLPKGTNVVHELVRPDFPS